MFESAKKIVADSGVAIFGDLMHIPSQGTFCHFSSKATKKGLMLRFDSMFTSLSVLHHVLKSDRTFTDAEARKAGISDRGVEVRQ
jgi:hypothetical protein